MPDVKTLIRRRSRRQRGGLPLAARLSLAVMVLVPIVIGAASVALASMYLELTQIVPAVAEIETYFGREAGPPFQATRVEDRRGDRLFTLEHPGAAEAEWVDLEAGDHLKAPAYLPEALVTGQDPTFWQNPGYEPGRSAVALAGDLVRRGDRPRPLTITEQLLAATLLPAEDYGRYSVQREFRLMLLAERLTKAYSKSQILVWYMNSADFGELIYGVDAAALVYFGKHADELSLPESALLAVLPQSPPGLLEDLGELRSERNRLLAEMKRRGIISDRQWRAARAQAVVLQEHSPGRSADPILGPLVQEILVDSLDAGALARGGLTVHLTIDGDLQAQAQCVLRTQLERLTGASPTVTAPTSDGGACRAAGLLPPLRPGDTGVDHNVGSGSVVVIDPNDGQLLALAAVPADAGPETALTPVPAGEMLYPFVYLTAFSRGFAPASMVLDLPQSGNPPPEELRRYEGPVSMRTALVGGLQAAAGRTLQLAGMENALRTLEPLGLTGPEGRRPTADQIVDGELLVDPITLTQAYGVLANEGQMVGRSGLNGPLQPILVLGVSDRFGRNVVERQPRSQSVISEGLAYLLIDVLSDDAARWSVFGQPNVFEIGRPAGTVVGETPDQTGAWTIGFTPNLSVGVWLGKQEAGEPTRNLRPQNGPGAIWNALGRYATQDRPAEGWTLPPGVSTMEVCVPSGLLPTEYCPEVVEEVFLQGTEPSSADNLYQPLRVNRETGNLATLRTPFDLVQERVYFVPPPEAADWAEAAGIEQPPSEYDPLPSGTTSHPEVRIEAPEPFSVVSGEVVVRGKAEPEGFEYYRLQYGQGLNPTRWIQIGSDESERALASVLGRWDVEGLSGLYTLQLIVVKDEGEIVTAAVPVTVDGKPPEVEVLLPRDGAVLSREREQRLVVEVRADDDVGIRQVDLYLDDEQAASLDEGPFIFKLELPEQGTYTLTAEAVDGVGRSARTEPVEFTVLP